MYQQNTELPYTRDRLIGGDLRSVYKVENYIAPDMWPLVKDNRPFSQRDYQVLV